jgi:hypothetical protein
MTRRDDPETMSTLFRQALSESSDGGPVNVVESSSPDLEVQELPTSAAVSIVEKREETTRTCPGCGEKLPLKRITCPACYRRDFAPVLGKGKKGLAHRMAILGLAGCGKTVFLTQLFWFLEEDAYDNPAFPWTVRLETAGARRFIQEGRARFNAGQWPLKTSAFSEQAVHASVRNDQTGRKFQLLINDVSGESVQKFFSNADRPEDDPEHAAYLAHLFNSQSFLLLLDAKRLTRRDAWDIDGFANMFAKEHGIDAEPKDLWLSLVITKADELEESYSTPEELARGCLRGTFSRLEECFRYISVFVVSAAGQVIPNPAGKEPPTLPDPYALPVGIHEPLAWILEGVENYDDDRQDRKRQRLEQHETSQIERDWEESFQPQGFAPLRLLLVVVVGLLFLAGIVAVGWKLSS